MSCVPHPWTIGSCRQPIGGYEGGGGVGGGMGGQGGDGSGEGGGGGEGGGVGVGGGLGGGFGGDGGGGGAPGSAGGGGGVGGSYAVTGWRVHKSHLLAMLQSGTDAFIAAYRESHDMHLSPYRQSGTSGPPVQSLPHLSPSNSLGAARR